MRTTTAELTALEAEALVDRRLAQITPPRQPTRTRGGSVGTGSHPGLVQWAWDKHEQRPAPQPLTREPMIRLDQRLVDLQRITGSGVAPPYSITPAGADTARGRDSGRALDGGSRER
jgi:hypothetical protein